MREEQLRGGTGEELEAALRVTHRPGHEQLYVHVEAAHQHCAVVGARRDGLVDQVSSISSVRRQGMFNEIRGCMQQSLVRENLLYFALLCSTYCPPPCRMSHWSRAGRERAAPPRLAAHPACSRRPRSGSHHPHRAVVWCVIGRSMG